MSDTFLALNIPRIGDSTSGRLEEQARARGHAAGYTEGLRAARAEIDGRTRRFEAEHAAAVQQERAKTERVVSVLASAARALDDRTVPVVTDSRQALAAAAVELAEAILGYELADEARSARGALDRALSGSDPRRVQVVRVNPHDLALLPAGLRADAGVEFTADPALGRGDAVTEFPDGFLDARISTALTRAKTALLRENP